jgi:hypothetical protein
LRICSLSAVQRFPAIHSEGLVVVTDFQACGHPSEGLNVVSMPISINAHHREAFIVYEVIHITVLATIPILE